MFSERTILTVTQLNKRIRQWIEDQCPILWISGEVSNLIYAASGHCYFSLKDAQAQIRCVQFKSLDKFKNGDHLNIKGRITLYEPRGDYQFIVEKIEHVGQGKLYQHFIELKNKLEKAGYFSVERKKSIPVFPQSIGIITSAIGAAQHDIMTTLQRRYPIASLRFYFSDVQGEKAVEQLIAAIEKANQEALCDVLILGRGGGSFEDLQAFNAESLAYAILNSRLPIVTGIGHETDFTIADFVSDYRAATPTAAAEKVSPDCRQLVKQCEIYSQRLRQAIQNRLEKYQQQLVLQNKKMHSPVRQLFLYKQSLDFLTQALHQYVKNTLSENKLKTQPLIEKLGSLSPLATLARGYAIALTETGQIIQTVDQVSVAQHISLQINKGKLLCNILEIKHD